MAGEQSKDWLTIEEACEELGVSKSTLYRWRDEGRLTFYRFGPRTVRLRAADLRALAQPGDPPAGSPAAATPSSLAPSMPSPEAALSAGGWGPPTDTVEAQPREIGDAVTWDQLVQAAGEGLHSIFRLCAALFTLHPSEEVAAQGGRALGALVVPRSWLEGHATFSVASNWPYVAGLLNRVQAQLAVLEQKGGQLLPPVITLLPLDNEVEFARREELPGVVAATALRGRYFHGFLAIADPTVDLSPGQGRQMLDLWAMLLAQAADNVWRVGEYERMALTDHLTGLKNRRAFEHMITRELARTQRYGRPVTLVLLDLDNFKTLNDLCGHPEGDRALQRVGAWLRHNVRKTDVVARVGGDEFAIICSDTDMRGAEAMARRLAEGITRLDLGGGVRVSACLGIAEASEEDMSIAELYRRADVALYAAKSAGGGVWRVYSQELEESRDESPPRAAAS